MMTNASTNNHKTDEINKKIESFSKGTDDIRRTKWEIQKGKIQ